MLGRRRPNGGDTHERRIVPMIEKILAAGPVPPEYQTNPIHVFWGSMSLLPPCYSLFQTEIFPVLSPRVFSSKDLISHSF
jgi:hypothetical protein